MKYTPVLIMVILLISPIGTKKVGAETNTSDNIKVNVVVDSTFTDFDLIKQLVLVADGYEFKSTPSVESGDSYINVLDISVEQLETEEHKELVSYLRSIEVMGETGNTFNSTAFESGRKNESIIPKTGRSYNASETLEWLGDNLWDRKENEYTFYILNLTELDTDGIEHWFTSFPKDPDTDKPITKFYSGTKEITYGMDNMGWGGEFNLPIQFLDLSARSWFGDFVNTAWSKYGWQPKAINLTLADWEGKYDTVAYTNWLFDSISPMFYNQFVNFNWALPSLVREGLVVSEVEVINFVFSNWTVDSDWILDDKWIEGTFEKNFRWLDFIVETKNLNLSDDPELKQTIESQLEYNYEEERYELPVERSFLDYLENTLVPKYIEENTSRIQLPAFSFLLSENVRMTYYGISFAGLGGSGWQLQSIPPSRLYDEDGTPSVGMSSVLTHEIGHSIGLPHPFFTGTWSSDFTASVMGYFTNYEDFSVFDRHKVSRQISLYYINQLMTLNVGNGSATISSIIEKAKEAHANWDFDSSIELTMDAIRNYDELVKNELTTLTSTSSSTTQEETRLLLPMSVFIALYIVSIRLRKRN